MSHDESAERSQAAGYSSYVELQLQIDGQCYPLGQIGPDFVQLREPLELQPCDAEIVMRVDGKQRRWLITLPHGSTLDNLDVPTIDR